MAISKRPGSKNWQIEFVLDGRRYQRSAKTGDKKAARNIENQWKADLAQGRAGITKKPASPPFRTFAQDCLVTIRVRIAKTRTVEFYEQQTRVLLAFEPLAKANIDEIDERLINAFVQHRSEQVSNASVNRALATLRKFLGMAYEWKQIERIPRVKKLNGEQGREFVLSSEQERVYIEAAPQPLKDIALLLVDSGLRVSEALNLKWTDIRLEHTQAHKAHLTVREGKSTNAKRTIGLTGRVIEMLRSRLSESCSEFIFPGKSGKPMRNSSVSHLHSKVRLQVKLPGAFVLHSLRHTYLTRLGDAGVDAFVLQKIAGHGSVVVSQRYVHPSRDAMERAVSLLEARNATTSSRAEAAD